MFTVKRKKQDIRQYLFVIKELVSREVKRKYARSYLGILWSVLNPLMTMAVLSMIFSSIFKRSIENYPIYFLTGNILWQLFSSSTNAAMTALVDNRTLLLKVKMPKQVFILARIYTAVTNFGYVCIAYVLMMLVFHIQPSVTMLLFLFDVVFLILFSMGVGYALSIAYVFFGDIKHLYSVILTLWMYMSAIFYPYESLNRLMQIVIGANPIYRYIAFARDVVMHQKIPESSEFFGIMLWGIASFLIGYRIFRKNENLVMQRI